MALDLGTETIVIKERTYKIEIMCPLSGDYSLKITRQKVWVNSDSKLVNAADAPEVIRNFKDIMAQEFTVGGVTMTGAQLAGFLAGTADILRQEDIANGII